MRTSYKQRGEKLFTVLVADDDDMLRMIISRIARSVEGVEVIEAKDGQEAVDLAAQHSPDMLLFDINMPRLDGFQACRSIIDQQAGRQLPVWFVSGDYENVDRDRAKAVNARGFLIKPFGCEEVRCAVQEVMAETAAA